MQAKMQLFGNIYHITYFSQYIECMKKIFYIITATCSILAILPACNNKIDYFDYVSEIRRGVYIYEEDGLSLKLHYSERETPYLTDGIKGDMNDVCEVFVTLTSRADEIFVTFDEAEGEMNYLAVSQSFYLSLPISYTASDKIEVVLDIDGKEKSVEAVNVLYDGVIDARTALSCVEEYDGKLFESLSQKGIFCGEIYIRLLYDQGCFYYVGVTDRNGNTNAFLLDGETGRIIAERSTS
jgi:hypothetical protein